MRPTFVAFTPWTTPRDYVELLDFVAEHDLVEAVDPVQYAIRLLIPPGSALLASADAGADAGEWLGQLDEAAFSYTWAHPDPRMDALQREMWALAEDAARTKRPVAETFADVRTLAEERLAIPTSSRSRRLGAAGGVRTTRRPVPHLTEAWFC